MTNPPNLENRFLAPPNWKTDLFENDKTGHVIHYGWSCPQNALGSVIILQGLQEFTEKYYETARFFLKHNYNVVLFEWHYQGRSGRFKKKPHKRHSDGFETDVLDLHHLIENCLYPLSGQQTPLHMVAHSTGGNIGLRFLLEYPSFFRTASFSAPLMGIYGLSAFPDWVILGLLNILNLWPESYIPGGHDWKKDDRKSDGSDKFSSDPVLFVII